MKLEDQVCSLNLAEKLRKLGVRQDGHFWWHDCEHPIGGHVDRYVSDIREYDTDPAFETVCSAFTVAELGEMLPRHVEVKFRRVRDGEYRVMMEVEGKWIQEDGGELADTIAHMLT